MLLIEWRKSLALLLATLVIYQTVATPVAEANFWEARRATVSTSSSLEPANLELQAPISSYGLNANLPLAGFTIPSDLGQTVETFYPRDVILSGTKNLAVTERPFAGAQGDSKPPIIHIQDAHEIVGAQQNAAEILKSIHEEMKAKSVVVAVEGAWGPVDSDRLAAFPNKDAKVLVAESFLAQKKLFGEEARAIMDDPGAWKIVGVEDKDLYLANGAAKSKVEEARSAVLPYIEALQGAMSRLAVHVDSPDLRVFKLKARQYKLGRISLQDYLKYLSGVIARSETTKQSRREIEIASPSARNDGHLNLNKVLELAEIEKTVRARWIEDERKALVEQASRRLGEKNLKTLLDQSLAFRLGRVSPLAYHRFLIEIADGLKFPVPNLVNYVRYLRFYESIDVDKIPHELQALELRTGEAFASNAEAKALFKMERWLALQEKAWKLDLTPEEFADYKKSPLPTEGEGLRPSPGTREAGGRGSGWSSAERKPGEGGWPHFTQTLSSLIKRSGLGLTLPSMPSQISSHAKSISDFYRLAEARNKALVRNTLRLCSGQALSVAKETHQPVVLIAGGYHTPGITHLFKEAGQPYMVIRPSLEVAKIHGPLLVRNSEASPERGTYRAVEHLQGRNNFGEILAAATKIVESHARGEEVGDYYIEPIKNSSESLVIPKDLLSKEDVTPNDFAQGVRIMPSDEADKLRQKVASGPAFRFTSIGKVLRNAAPIVSEEVQQATVVPAEKVADAVKTTGGILGEFKIPGWLVGMAASVLVLLFAVDFSAARTFGSFIKDRPVLIPSLIVLGYGLLVYMGVFPNPLGSGARPGSEDWRAVKKSFNQVYDQFDPKIPNDRINRTRMKKLLLAVAGEPLGNLQQPGNEHISDDMRERFGKIRYDDAFWQQRASRQLFEDKVREAFSRPFPVALADLRARDERARKADDLDSYLNVRKQGYQVLINKIFPRPASQVPAPSQPTRRHPSGTMGRPLQAVLTMGTLASIALIASAYMGLIPGFVAGGAIAGIIAVIALAALGPRVISFLRTGNNSPSVVAPAPPVQVGPSGQVSPVATNRQPAAPTVVPGTLRSFIRGPTGPYVQSQPAENGRPQQPAKPNVFGPVIFILLTLGLFLNPASFQAANDAISSIPAGILVLGVAGLGLHLILNYVFGRNGKGPQGRGGSPGSLFLLALLALPLATAVASAAPPGSNGAVHVLAGGVNPLVVGGLFLAAVAVSYLFYLAVQKFRGGASLGNPLRQPLILAAITAGLLGVLRIAVGLNQPRPPDVQSNQTGQLPAPRVEEKRMAPSVVLKLGTFEREAPSRLGGSAYSASVKIAPDQEKAILNHEQIQVTIQLKGPADLTKLRFLASAHFNKRPGDVSSFYTYSVASLGGEIIAGASDRGRPIPSTNGIYELSGNGNRLLISIPVREIQQQLHNGEPGSARLSEISVGFDVAGNIPPENIQAELVASTVERIPAIPRNAPAPQQNPKEPEQSSARPAPAVNHLSAGVVAAAGLSSGFPPFIPGGFSTGLYFNRGGNPVTLPGQFINRFLNFSAIALPSLLVLVLIFGSIVPGASVPFVGSLGAVAGTGFASVIPELVNFGVLTIGGLPALFTSTPLSELSGSVGRTLAVALPVAVAAVAAARSGGLKSVFSLPSLQRVVLPFVLAGAVLAGTFGIGQTSGRPSEVVAVQQTAPLPSNPNGPIIQERLDSTLTGRRPGEGKKLIPEALRHMQLPSGPSSFVTYMSFSSIVETSQNPDGTVNVQTSDAWQRANMQEFLKGVQEENKKPVEERHPQTLVIVVDNPYAVPSEHVHQFEQDHPGKKPVIVEDFVGLGPNGLPEDLRAIPNNGAVRFVDRYNHPEVFSDTPSLDGSVVSIYVGPLVQMAIEPGGDFRLNNRNPRVSIVRRVGSQQWDFTDPRDPRHRSDSLAYQARIIDLAPTPLTDAQGKQHYALLWVFGQLASEHALTVYDVDRMRDALTSEGFGQLANAMFVNKDLLANGQFVLHVVAPVSNMSYQEIVVAQVGA